MKISVYMETIAYKYGGAEAYTACLIESLQRIFPGSHIQLITEHLKGSARPCPSHVIEMQNSAYGTDIKNENFSLSLFGFKKIDENLVKSKLIRAILLIQKEFFAIKRFKSIRKFSKGSDLFINGSFKIISGNAKNNLCLVHFPYKPCVTSGINSRLSWFKSQAKKRDFCYQNGYNLYLPNSNFTASWLKRIWNVSDSKIKVLYPPVRMTEQSSKKDSRQIFCCSRICPDKKIDVLIKAYSSSPFLKENSRLVVAGSVKGEDSKFIEELKKNSSDKVEFIFEPSRQKLEELYATSGIFWHAKGFGEENPFESEHFGITTVEAMSAGCIPVVIDKGGQKEIVSEGCGFKWNTVEELIEKTEWLIKNPEKAESFRKSSIERAEHFNTENFTAHLKNVLSEVCCA